MLNLPFTPPLSKKDKLTWEEQGYLHLKRSVSRKAIERVKAAVNWHWAHPTDNPHHVDVLTGRYAGRCFQMSEAPEGLRGEAYKLNNLFLHDERIRSVALSPYLQRVVKSLLRGEPMICNSLNFERGSQQEAHIDSWYMAPPAEDGMVAASISLDPVDDDNGPIFFYPGSHKITPYRFSDGRLNMKEDEFDQCRAYLDTEISKRGLKPVRFSGEAGDVFIWHGQLIHGGSKIEDFGRTRNSLVVHYWRAEDVEARAVRRDSAGRAYLAHTLRGELMAPAD
ncbi:MAG: phytanoyl-CoA dioxygenase family protein [Alphaproteobacteria bacterium]|jgi:hypothetical protein|uniref:phytanoyl-CoA dioxygenase family protein n=1 Tax=Brevundimonas aurantiaca TaxID=74316 RepID=UPI0017499F6D|nr:phytanoyl-CoA dioxygenase family protein [Brevundimonas aurantiaca]MBU1347605.1 phytanoyl-CoA dioxygenase family protein [Alphaproteobacteria bacterium]